MGNMFLYPAPRSSYKHFTEDHTLIFVPQKAEKVFCGAFCTENRKEITKIPCRYIECQKRTSPYLIMFFHGNSEDLGEGLSIFLSQLSNRFMMNVICPEYPSYGIYQKRDESLNMDEAIIQDARQVMKHCVSSLRYSPDNIILMGRSLGTGVIAQLASEFKVRGSILISPFTSIREVAKNMVGNILSKVVPDVFRSIDYIDKIESPILFIHGEDDALIPAAMATQLHDKAQAPKDLVINEEMTHNMFRIESDICTPIHFFMQEKLELKTHLYSKRGKIMDSYVPRNLTFLTENYEDALNEDSNEIMPRFRSEP